MAAINKLYAGRSQCNIHSDSQHRQHNTTAAEPPGGSSAEVEVDRGKDDDSVSQPNYPHPLAHEGKSHIYRAAVQWQAAGGYYATKEEIANEVEIVSTEDDCRLAYLEGELLLFVSGSAYEYVQNFYQEPPMSRTGRRKSTNAEASQ